MLEFVSLNENKFLLVTNDNSIYLFDNESGNLLFEYKHNLTITTSTYLPKRNLLLLTDINKKLNVINVKDGNVLYTKNISKKAAKLISNSEETELILGDKTGDVYALKIGDDEVKNEFELTMGHMSMLTDMKLISNEKLLVTADRDEKIRLSHFPNAYNIHSYLMAHKEFVRQIEIANDKNIISVSGDSKLMTWSIDTNKPFFQIDVRTFLPSELANNFKGIVRFDFDPSSKKILLLLYKANFLMSFNYDSEANKIEFDSMIDLGERVDDFVRLSNNHFIFLKSDSNEKFEARSINKSESLKDFEGPGKKIVRFLNEKIILKNNLRSEIEQEFESYYKLAVNNLNEYYERKQERIAALNAKRKRTDTQNTDESNQ